MKTVSAAYAEDIALPLRDRSYVVVVFENVETTAAADGSWSASPAQASWAETSKLDEKYAYNKSLVTLEQNRWVLDGGLDLFLPQSALHDGYVSSALTGSAGAFSSAQTLTKTFSSAHNLLGLTLIFDSREGSFPDSVTITMTGSGGSTVYSGTITPTNGTYVLETRADGVTGISLSFNSAYPNERARLERVVYGIEYTFDGDVLTETNQSHDVDPLCRRLPQEEFRFSIIDFDHNYDPENPDGIWAYVDLNAPIYIQHGYTLSDGTVEWLKPDRYRLSAKPAVEGSIASFQATGLIGSLNGTYYKSAVGSKTLYNMAVGVLTDAGFDTDEYDIDSSLQSMTTTAVLPIATHKECLQLIAHAARCRLYTDDDNIVHIKPFSVSGLTSSGFTLDFDSIKDGSPTLTKIEALKGVTVAKHSYTAAASSSTLYSGTTDATTAHVEFALAQDVSINVTGGTLTSSTIYGRAADLVMSSGTKTITVTGKTLTDASIVYTYSVGLDGETDAEDNPLITSDTMANALAAHVAGYLIYRSTYDVEYRGNPELETGDLIAMETRYNDSIDALVLTDAITFNGALSGTIKVKALV